jgi:hypothetical protein
MEATFSERDGTTAGHARRAKRIQTKNLNHQEMGYDSYSSNHALTFGRPINHQPSGPISAGGILPFALQSEIQQGAGQWDGGKSGDGAGVVAPDQGLSEGAEDMTQQDS